MLHSPSVLPTGLLFPLARNGTEFTKYPVAVPVLIAGSSPVTGSPARETGPRVASLTTEDSATSCGLGRTIACAPSKLLPPGPQNSSVDRSSALLSNPVFGWSPKHVSPSELSNL